ncbi:MAG: FHA domain-containing protein, partial [Candidatus Obscuribacterales bacterium]|nr:FHA domain-containing protein [Candidatus Obscuribacterales bacterium]
DGPVSLVDMVTGNPLPVATPICRVGRDLGNDIALAGDRSMSRFHFQIRQTADQEYYIEDLGSRNGTFLNGSPIATPRKLQPGDIVSAGVSRYKFEVQSNLQPAPAQNIGQVPDLSNPASSAPQLARSAAYDASAQEISDALSKLRSFRGNTPGAAPSHETSFLTNAQNQHEQPLMAEEEPYLSAELPGKDTVGIPPQISQSLAAQAPESLRPPVEPPSALKSLVQNGAAALSQVSWFDDYVFPEIQKLMSEKERLNSLVEEIKQDVKLIDRKIASTQGISQALLAASGPELAQAAKQVLDTLDWQAEPGANNPHEIHLKKASKIEAVVRIVVCQTDPTMKDFEALVSQQAVVWCQYNYEPKGIMLVQVRPDLHPNQRPALGADFLENMRRKKMCIIQAKQLLAIYRLVMLSGHDKAHFKELLMNTCGAMPGLVLKAEESTVATA